MNKITLALVVGLLAGCASVTPNYDAKFGDAVRGARQAQTLNPTSAPDADPVVGLDAQAAVSAQQRYQDSFKSPPQTFEVISSGGNRFGQ